MIPLVSIACAGQRILLSAGSTQPMVPSPNNALQRTEAGGGVFSVSRVLRRPPPSLSLDPLDDIPMGPVPPDFTLEQFVGRQLNQVCIGPFDLQFCFDSKIVISCQGRVVVEIDGRSVVVFLRDDPWWADVTPLPRLAGRDCVSWRVDGSHEFSITLSGDARLSFQSTDCPYEEFITHPDIQVV